MRLSDKWQDYCLIDTSDGERLERWGDVTLIRPDPQIIWKCSGEAPEWRTAHAKYNRSSSGGGSWDYRRKLPESWQIKYVPLATTVLIINIIISIREITPDWMRCRQLS